MSIHVKNGLFPLIAMKESFTKAYLRKKEKFLANPAFMVCMPILQCLTCCCLVRINKCVAVFVCLVKVFPFPVGYHL